MLYKFISIPTVNKRCEKATGDFLFYVVFLEKNFGSFLFFIWFVRINACDLKWNKWLSCLSSDVLQKDYIDHFVESVLIWKRIWNSINHHILIRFLNSSNIFSIFSISLWNKISQIHINNLVLFQFCLIVFSIL